MSGMISLAILIVFLLLFYLAGRLFKPPKIEDPVFGEMEGFLSSWSCTTFFPPENHDIELWLETEDGEPPGERHHRLWRELVEDFPTRRPEWLEEIRRRADPEVLLGDGIQEIRLTSVEFPLEEDAFWTLEFSATDGTHRYNVGIEVENGSVIEVDIGPADDETRREGDRRLREKYDIRT